MNEYTNPILEKLKQSSDVVIKKIPWQDTYFYLVLNEVLTDSDYISNFIIRSLKYAQNNNIQNLEEYLLGQVTATNIKLIKKEEFYDNYLNGFAILLFNDNKYLAIEARSNLNRGISEATYEPSIRGSKDGFIEHFNTNLGLIRKRIKSPHLKLTTNFIGRETNTKVGIIYMDNIVKKGLPEKIEEKLKTIDIDGILDSSYLKEQLENKTNYLFPTVMVTERPDKVSMALLEGKVAILVDNSPNALILPTFFIDFFHTTDDYYQKPINVTFVRIIRLLAFFIAILIPAYYIAITTHNQDAISLNLLTQFASARASVPYPALIEALLMTISFEILRESDIRMPSYMGTAVSILGGLVLGDAAVSAGIISPIMIIVIAISAISGLLFSEIEVVSAIRWYRIFFLFLAAFFGIYGIFIAAGIMIYNIASLESFNLPYLAPFSPIIKEEQKDALLKMPTKKIKYRNILLSKNKVRERIK